MEKLKTVIKKWNAVFCRGMICKKHIGRDAAVVLASAVIAAGLLSVKANPLPKRTENIPAPRETGGEDLAGIVAGEESPPPLLAEKVAAGEDTGGKKAVEPSDPPPKPKITAPKPKSRPPAPPKPKITAPKPVSFKAVGGKLVCAKKNDKPRKSKQHKGKHMDMECCLDPDETPNPWCTY